MSKLVELGSAPLFGLPERTKKTASRSLDGGDFPGADAAPHPLPADFAALSLLVGCELRHVSTLRGRDFVALDLSTRRMNGTKVAQKRSWVDHWVWQEPWGSPGEALKIIVAYPLLIIFSS